MIAKNDIGTDTQSEEVEVFDTDLQNDPLHSTFSQKEEKLHALRQVFVHWQFKLYWTNMILSTESEYLKKLYWQRFNGNLYLLKFWLERAYKFGYNPFKYMRDILPEMPKELKNAAIN